MNKKYKRLITIFVVIPFLIWAAFMLFHREDIETNRQYKCDVKNFRLSTDIVVKQEDKKVAQVTGNIFRVVEDPLTLKDADGNKIGYAGDDYHLIAQDSHVIIMSGVVTAELVGKWDLFGETYYIYDSEGQRIATASFNWTNTYGKIVDTDGNLLAEYESFILFNDFDVRIAEDCPIDDGTVIMIFSSYYSDQSYDNS